MSSLFSNVADAHHAFTTVVAQVRTSVFKVTSNIVLASVEALSHPELPDVYSELTSRTIYLGRYYIPFRTHPCRAPLRQAKTSGSVGTHGFPAQYLRLTTNDTPEETRESQGETEGKNYPKRMHPMQNMHSRLLRASVCT